MFNKISDKGTRPILPHHMIFTYIHIYFLLFLALAGDSNPEGTYFYCICVACLTFNNPTLSKHRNYVFFVKHDSGPDEISGKPPENYCKINSLFIVLSLINKFLFLKHYHSHIRLSKIWDRNRFSAILTTFF